MKAIKRKVFAYITHRDRLLVFRHTQYPDAGIQVPAGTVEDGENLKVAVVREACEETGLEKLKLNSFLGIHARDMSDVGRNEFHLRHFYHLICEGNPPETWRHIEKQPSEGEETEYESEFFWAKLPDDVPDLVCDHGYFLSKMIETMKRGNSHVQSRHNWQRRWR